MKDHQVCVLNNNGNNYICNNIDNKNLHNIDQVNNINDDVSGDASDWPTWDLANKCHREMSFEDELLHSYCCTMYKDRTYAHGHLLISTYRMSFTTQVSPAPTLILPWSHINDITHQKTSKVMSDAVRVVTDDGVTLYLSLFVNFEVAWRSLIGAWQSGQLLERIPTSLVISEVDKTTDELTSCITSTLHDEGILTNNHTHNQEEIVCPCSDHNGTEYINQVLNIDIESLFHHLFSQDSDLMRTVFAQRKWEKATYTRFQRDDTTTEEGGEVGTMRRTLTYTIPVGLKRAHTTTTHTVSEHDGCYVVRAQSTTSGVPYGDDFIVSTTYCITGCPTPNKSRLRVMSEIVFVKKMSALSRKIVTKGAHEGMKDFTNCLIKVIKSESDLLAGGAVNTESILREKTKGRKEKTVQIKHPE